MLQINSDHQSRTFFKRGFLILILSQLFACGGENGDRPEVLNKLRALGVEQSPINAKPGDTVTLNFYLAALPGQSIVPEIELDTASRYGIPTLVTPVDAKPTETQAGAYSVYNYRGTFTVPTDSQVLSASLARQGYGRMRYKVKFSVGADYETVVGDAVVYLPDAPQISWKSPDISIAKPAATGTEGTMDVEGIITSEGVEPYRVSWFVSDGKIKNRRAKATSWSDAAKGAQTLIMTVRGTKSGAFAIKSQTVTIN